MLLRSCSILGTLVIALAFARPALAESSTQRGGTSVGAKKTKDKDKDKGKDKASSSDSEGQSEASSAPQPAPEPEADTWEKPPAEQEKPVGPPPKPPEPPVGDGRKWSAGLLAGWAFKTDRGTANLGADPYQLGIGLRGGYSLDFNLYVGIYFNYYIGSSETGMSALVNVPAQKHSANYMHTGVEAGYDAWVGPVIIRPSLQIGAALARTDNSPSGGTITVTRPMFGPGITVIDPIDSFFIAGDLRANLVPSSNGVSAVLFAVSGGFRFH